MSTRTPNYDLVKPELTDTADITAMNENWDTIDTELKKKLDANGGAIDSIYPKTQLSGFVGTSDLPFNNVFARYVNIYGGAGKQYGRFRVGITGTTDTQGTAVLELGNDIPMGTSHCASGKITMYGTGTGFTNILPNASTTGSNSVTLPTATGQLSVFEASSVDITAGSTALMTGKSYFVYE